MVYPAVGRCTGLRRREHLVLCAVAIEGAIGNLKPLTNPKLELLGGDRRESQQPWSYEPLPWRWQGQHVLAAYLGTGRGC